MPDPQPIHARDAQPVRAHARSDLIRHGADLVAISESFYVRVFVAGLAIVGLSALATLILFPIRPFASTAPVAPAAVLVTAIVAATPVAIRHAAALYRRLRREAMPQIGLTLVAAALVAHPALSGELWWPSCAILMLLAIAVDLKRALTWCLAVLVTNLAGHMIAGDLADAAPVAILGPWILYPIWVGAVAAATDRLGAYLLLLNRNANAERGRQPPRRVRVSTPKQSVSHEAPTARVGLDQPRVDSSTTTNAEELSARLTARQLQVVALLADGLRQREIASCLSISERQVQRHIANAIARLRLRSAYELAALAVATGLIPEQGVMNELAL